MLNSIACRCWYRLCWGLHNPYMTCMIVVAATGTTPSPNRSVFSLARALDATYVSYSILCGPEFPGPPHKNIVMQRHRSPVSRQPFGPSGFWHGFFLVIVNGRPPPPETIKTSRARVRLPVFGSAWGTGEQSRATSSEVGLRKGRSLVYCD